jgi:hypothetical protein
LVRHYARYADIGIRLIGDACDLGWKLAGALHGFGGPGLLASYDAERRPIGLRNRSASGRHAQVRAEIGALYIPDLTAPGAPRRGRAANWRHR